MKEGGRRGERKGRIVEEGKRGEDRRDSGKREIKGR